MTDSEKRILETFATKVLKLSPEEVASLYNDAGELTDISVFEKKDSERISKLNSDKNNQYARGLKEGAGKLEKELKEKYEVDSDLIGLELFEFVLDNKIQEVKTADPKEVLKHPEVIRALSQKDKEKKQADKDWQKKYDDLAKQGDRNRLLDDVEKSAFVIFDGEKYILPEDPKKAKALRDVFSGEIRRGNFQKDNDSFIVLKEDGSPLQDEFGHNVTFDDFVRNIGERYFDKQVAEDRSGTGAKNNGSAQGGQGKPKITIKNREDYLKQMKTAKTAQERIDVQNAYEVFEKSNK